MPPLSRRGPCAEGDHAIHPLARPIGRTGRLLVFAISKKVGPDSGPDRNVASYGLVQIDGGGVLVPLDPEGGFVV